MADYNVDEILQGREVLQVNCYDPSNRVVLFVDDEHSYIREHFLWEQKFDKKGEQLPESNMILLKDITSPHLKSLCYLSVNWKDNKLNKVFVDEWNWRVENELP